MIGDYKIVWYDRYCPTCKHKDLCETEDPCNECLTECAVIDSHKPIKYEKEE